MAKEHALENFMNDLICAYYILYHIIYIYLPIKIVNFHVQ
jgi:hypothetical protein